MGVRRLSRHDFEEMLKLLEPVLNVTSDAIRIRNRQGETIFSNRAYENMMRRSKNEAVCDSSEIIWDKHTIGTVEVYHDISELNRLKRELDKVNQKLRKSQGKYTFRDIIGNAPELRRMIRIAGGAAATPATIMIRGESGTGKEIVAHAIHNGSNRRYENFVKVNCTSLPEELIESELFGYMDGAFTGARRGGKKGLFQEAHRGTLFLDEVGDISLRMQMKLLRALQEKEIMPVGATDVIKVDVRIICATNKNLEEMIDNGKFRDDLYYRLNVFPLFIPPLRERLEDIGDISRYLINRYNELYNRNVREIEAAAIEILMGQKWKGNVRELENVLSRTMINMDEDEAVLKRSHLLATFGVGAGRNPAGAVSSQRVRDEGFPASIAVRLNEAWEEAERNCIRSALERNGDNKTGAAYELGVSLRTLYYKCNKLGL
jgi:transcriptional regulator with PAS, ATPase and Fis domain